MKGKVLKPLGLAVVVTAVMLVVLVCAPSASANAPEEGNGPGGTLCPPGDGSKQKVSCALDNLDRLKDTLETEGFTLEEGDVAYLDWVQKCCQGVLMDTGANNPWPNVYITLGFGTGALNHLWQLGENEAIIMVGQTPPAAAYFSYNTILGFLPDDPDTAVNESQHRLGITVGDAINIGTVKTIGPDPFNRPIVYIITGHRGTERLVRAAALQAGYPNAIINVETISPAIGPLGRGEKGSWWFFAQRVAVPVDSNALQAFVRQAGALNKVFRVTPNDRLAKQLGDDPEPVPVLRVRGTGHTELDLYPALKRLRAAILQEYAPKGSDQPLKELDTHIWELDSPQMQDGYEMRVEKPYVGLQRGITALGPSRDTNYLATYPNFMLREGEDEFVIVYGVNHQKTGKATYASFSIYADRIRWFGLDNGTVLSANPNFERSAERYLPGDPDAQYLYAWKVARHCKPEDLPYCLEVKQQDFVDINGQPYQCKLYDFFHPENPPGEFNLDEMEMFFLWRAYMEPATKVGPDDNELLYDRAIYFGPYDFPAE